MASNDSYSSFNILPQEGYFTDKNSYLDEISNHELMTASKQDELYKRLDNLYPGRLSGNAPKWPPHECMPLVNEITGHFLRLVISVARIYARRRGKLEFNDLVQEGNIGLIRGVWRFDPSKGLRVSTYVTFWIRQSITRAIGIHGQSIRIPMYIHDYGYKLSNFINNYEKVNAELPSDAEIANFLNVDDAAAQDAMKLLKLSNSVSLDKERGEYDDPLTFYGLELQQQLNNVEGNIEDKELKEKIDMVLSEKLTTKEEQIIKMRYGLNNERRAMYLREISERYGLTRERIRQIEKVAMEKLRNCPETVKMLRELIL